MIPMRTNLYIDSTGGDVDAAMNIGRLIRENWLSTSIGMCLLDHGSATQYLIPREHVPGQCLSAATLVFLGGRLRYFPQGSRFGVHQFSFKNPSPNDVGKSQILSAKIARYVFDMEISPDFLELAASIDGQRIEYIEEKTLRAMKVVTGGETDVIWTLQSLDKDFYVRGERDSIYGHHKILIRFSAEYGFVLHAIIESQGHEYELMNFGVVEITFDGEESTIDISSRCTRMVHELYTNIGVQLTKDEACRICNSSGVGVKIKATPEAPMFLGISPMSTSEGRDKLITFSNVFGAKS